MNRKYIIYDGRLIMDHVDNHEDMVQSKQLDRSLVQGGGWWHLDRRRSVVYLWASSEDFGQPTKEVVVNAIEKKYLTGFQQLFKYSFSTSESLSEAIEEESLIYPNKR